MSSMNGWKRTHYCAELGKQDEGRTVVLNGWVDSRSCTDGMIHMVIRDRSGRADVVFDDAPAMEGLRTEELRPESVVAVKGIPMPADECSGGAFFSHMFIRATEIHVFSVSNTPPFNIKDEINARKELRYRYRYLDMRRSPVRDRLILKSRVLRKLREELDGEGFLEVHTPDKEEQPSLYSELLMAGGLDRCYEIKSPYAGEMPSMTVLQLAVSFTDMSYMMELSRKLADTVCSACREKSPELAFSFMTYDEALSTYGTGRPDNVFEMKIKDLSEDLAPCGYRVFSDAASRGQSIRGILAKGVHLSRKELDHLSDEARKEHVYNFQYVSFREDSVLSSFSRFVREGFLEELKQRLGAEDGDCLLIAVDGEEKAGRILGLLRKHLTTMSDRKTHETDEAVFIEKLPLLRKDPGENTHAAYTCMFAEPDSDDPPYLEGDADELRSRSFELIINGRPVMYGSMMSCDPLIQKRMLGKLGFSGEEAWKRHGLLMTASKYGMPPHAILRIDVEGIVSALVGPEETEELLEFPDDSEVE